MSQDEVSPFSWSRVSHREVSAFVGNELIYEYLTHSLDPERHKAVEQFIFNSKEAQQEMMKILNGIQYAERLSETAVSEPVIHRISEPSSYLAILLKKTNFQNWPTSVKWALEALFVVSLVTTTTLFIPWDRMSKINPFPDHSEAILAEIDRRQQVGDPDKLKEMEMSEPAEFAEEEKTESQSPAPKKPVASPVAPVVAAQPGVVSKPVAPEPEGKKAVGEGALYRGDIAVTNIEMVGPKIREKLIELGARKAGEVELGWKKSPDSSYFHFTLPAAKYAELKEYLAGYGQLKIQKEKHPRVMPDGIIRLIVTVEEAKK